MLKQLLYENKLIPYVLKMINLDKFNSGQIIEQFN